MKGFTHEKNYSEETEWYTPPWIFEKMGITFDLDPCSPEKPLPWIPATSFLTKREDGLITPWNGTVFMNPPYGRYTTAWMKKFALHELGGVALVFSRTDCAWFQDNFKMFDGINFLKGRIKFIPKGAKESTTPGSGSMLIAKGKLHCEAISKLDGCFIRLPARWGNRKAGHD